MGRSGVSDFAVFILTHGRPDNQITLETLRKQGYTGRVVLVIDDEDKTASEYLSRYGEDMVVMFNKKEMADQIDEGNNFDQRNGIIHARNASFVIAKKLGISYFIELDDDYQWFEYRLERGLKKVRNMDRLFGSLLEFYKSISAHTVALAQGGDFIGGTQNANFTNATLKRKCMNSFICSTSREFRFVGSVNEDVNTYTTLGSRGVLFLTVPLVSLTQKATQSQKGGMTDLYLASGTYVKSFTTVMMMPSAVKVAMMGDKKRRLHHQIRWRDCVPVILHEKHCKGMKQVDNR
jgi:hypothetical protein